MELPKLKINKLGYVEVTQELENYLFNEFSPLAFQNKNETQEGSYEEKEVILNGKKAYLYFDYSIVYNETYYMAETRYLPEESSGVVEYEFTDMSVSFADGEDDNHYELDSDVTGSEEY